jgi:hypothetical protein
LNDEAGRLGFRGFLWVEVLGGRLSTVRYGVVVLDGWMDGWICVQVDSASRCTCIGPPAREFTQDWCSVPPPQVSLRV